jgi:uncharacterized protein (TIGR02996 family)
VAQAARLLHEESTMDNEQALLEALHADPCDDTAWLALGDCLEENGQPERAELLRLHRALRRLGEGLEREQLEARVQRLIVAGVRPCVPRLTNSAGMELALIPPGWFWIGSPECEEGRYADESPRRLIELTRPFYLGVYPVTQEEYALIVGNNPSAYSSTGSQKQRVARMSTRRFPVEHISWHDAVSFCRRLSQRSAEKQAGRRYRLPTEIEWEYACRGGAALCSAYPCGRSISHHLANYLDPTFGPSIRKKLPNRPTPVGSYPPNGFGLCDMVGNVWEWCADWYSSDAYKHLPDRDPTGPQAGQRRNARGGTYALETRRVRSADRSSFEPDYNTSDIGLRVLCEWKEPS